MGAELYDAVKTVSRAHRGVIVSFSGGKDSAVVLDLCCRFFERVHAFYMYLVRGLSFQEAMLRWYAGRYQNLTIEQLPHFMVSEWFSLGTFRLEDASVPVITPNDIYDYVRASTGLLWIAGGERGAHP